MFPSRDFGRDQHKQQPNSAVDPALKLLASHGLAKTPAIQLILIDPQSGLRIEEDSPTIRAECHSLQRIISSALPPAALNRISAEVMGNVFEKLLPAIYRKAEQYPSEFRFYVFSKPDAGDMRDGDVPANFSFYTTGKPKLSRDEMFSFIDRELNRPLFDCFQKIYQRLVDPSLGSLLWDRPYFGGLRVVGGWHEPWKVNDRPSIIFRNPYHGVSDQLPIDETLVPEQVTERLIEPVDSDLHALMKDLICYRILPEFIEMGLGLPASLSVNVAWRPGSDRLSDYGTLAKFGVSFSQQPPLPAADLKRINDRYMNDELPRRILERFSEFVEQRIWSRRDELDYQVMEDFFGLRYQFQLNALQLVQAIPADSDPFSSPN